MLGYITLLLVCQLAGEVTVRLTGLPVPGPVIGMVILFLGLIARGGVPAGLEGVAGALLRHLSLLFVPAGVGVMLHVRLIADEWLPLTVALIISTVATIAATGLVMLTLLRNRRDEAP